MSEDLAFAGGAGGMTADLLDLRSTARVLFEHGTDLAGVAARARQLVTSSTLLMSIPFSPASAARVEDHLLRAAAQLALRTLRLEALALLLQTKAQLIEDADRLQAGAGRALEHVGGTAAGVLAAPLALVGASAGAGWFALGTAGESADAVADVLSGEVPLSELDDRLRAAPGEQAGDLRDAAVLFLRDHPGVTDAITGGLPSFVNAVAGPLAPLVPDDDEGLLGALLALAGPHGVLEDRPVQVGEQTQTPVPLAGIADVWQSANDLQRTVVHDSGASAVRVVSVVVDGTTRWVVQVPGTQEWAPVNGADPSDLTTNLELMDDGQAELMTAVVEAMHQAGIGPGEDVMLMGHSQGGITAAALAADPAVLEEFDVTTVFTGGSPIAQVGLPDGVSVVSLEHVQDPVPRLDSEADPDLPGWTTVTRDLGTELARLDAEGEAQAARGGEAYVPDPIAPHDGRRYQDTARLLDEAAARAAAGSRDPVDLEALRVRDLLQPFLGAGDGTDYRLTRR